MAKSGIYVETLIGGTIDEVWKRTQRPDLHELWDLRFSSISYLPRDSEKEPQRFTYSTRLGLGLKINGYGESTGTREAGTGLLTSALRFWSDDSKSLIEEGSGYWRYVPEGQNTRFITWYDYRSRFGVAGQVFDKLLFRPLISWATAWSFDRLRLWIERGVDPRIALQMSAIHAVARIVIAFIWFWQGLVPKLLCADHDERAMLAASGLAVSWLPWLGVAELAIGSVAVVGWRWRGFFIANALAMCVALLAVAVQSPGYLAAAFNPVTLNIGVIALSVTGYLAAEYCPTASRCVRRKQEG